MTKKHQPYNKTDLLYLTQKMEECINKEEEESFNRAAELHEIRHDIAIIENSKDPKSIELKYTFLQDLKKKEEALNEYFRSGSLHEKGESLNEFIGRKAIQEQFTKRLNIGSWGGVRGFLKRHHFKFRRTPSGKPMISENELVDLTK